jgi:hypothetical protein
VNAPARPLLIVISRAHQQALIVAGVAFALHLAFIGLPFVNQENAFNFAASYFRTGEETAIRRFFEADANTLAIPAAGAFLSYILGIGPEFGCRLLSVRSVAFFAVALHSIVENEGLPSSSALKVIILANPLIWIFARRGTADFYQWPPQ